MYLELRALVFSHFSPPPRLQRAMLQAQPYFALPWILTWFSHSLGDLDVVARIFDVLLVSHPLMPLYLAAAVSAPSLLPTPASCMLILASAQAVCPALVPQPSALEPAVMHVLCCLLCRTLPCCVHIVSVCHRML